MRGGEVESFRDLRGEREGKEEGEGETRSDVLIIFFGRYDILASAITRMNLMTENRRSFLRAGIAACGGIALSGRLNAQRDWSGRSPIHYPDPDVVVLDPRFAKIKAGNAA